MFSLAAASSFSFSLLSSALYLTCSSSNWPEYSESCCRRASSKRRLSESRRLPMRSYSARLPACCLSALPCRACISFAWCSSRRRTSSALCALSRSRPSRRRPSLSYSLESFASNWDWRSWSRCSNCSWASSSCAWLASWLCLNWTCRVSYLRLAISASAFISSRFSASLSLSSSSCCSTRTSVSCSVRRNLSSSSVTSPSSSFRYAFGTITISLMGA
mmetsp:Transcript_94168/g.245256  ORF Transcript_94168/g.245256 Transcript_94168/m.245256 type:complete len:218 (+) Transcript_94168:1007-1660(+)